MSPSPKKDKPKGRMGKPAPARPTVRIESPARPIRDRLLTPEQSKTLYVPRFSDVFRELADLTPEQIDARIAAKPPTMRERACLEAMRIAIDPDHEDRHEALKFIVERVEGRPKESVDIAVKEMPAIRIVVVDPKG